MNPPPPRSRKRTRASGTPPVSRDELAVWAVIAGMYLFSAIAIAAAIL